MDSHSPRYGSPYANSEVLIFNYSWFITFSHYTVSEHKHFPNIATKAGYPGTGMEQKKTGLENLTIPKKRIILETTIWSSLHLFWHYISRMAAWQMMLALFSFHVYLFFLCSTIALCGFTHLAVVYEGFELCCLVPLLWHCLLQATRISSFA